MRSAERKKVNENKQNLTDMWDKTSICIMRVKEAGRGKGAEKKTFGRIRWKSSQI